ncbi:putative chromatin remodeler Bromodomain family [Helianthus annuus]|nr:putative chromatin remodeler Bromodomain family [Helianthus annuus]
MEEDLMIGIDVDGDGIEKMEENNAAAAAAADDDDDDIGHQVDDLFTKVEKLEQRVNEIEQFYLTSSKMQSSTSQKSSFVKEKEKLKHIPGYKKHQQEAARREAIAAKRMQDIMRQFGSILRQITQHKWAWPFMQPVDVEGLGLRDYYEVIDRPMDFSTIKNQMEAKDGTEYKHVRDICSDVRLVFQNAMKYNDDKSDVHAMAKTLLEKFEEKWLQFLPRVTEEEKRREEEEAEAQLSIQRSQEAAHAKMARDLSNEVNLLFLEIKTVAVLQEFELTLFLLQLYETDMRLEKLRETVVQKCRKMSTEDKRNIGIALTRLCPEDLSKALDIVARHNPSFQSTAAEIDLDIDAQVNIIF